MIYAENILICIATPLLFSLLFVKGWTRLFVITFLTGMVMCLLSGYINGFVSFAGTMSENDVSIFVSPITEEIMKIFPILFVMLLFDFTDTVVVSGAIGVGVGFATFENICYLLSFGVNKIVFILIRGMAVGVMHIMSVVVVTVALLIAKRFHCLSLPGIMGALALSMTFHALYNLLVSEPGINAYVGYTLPVLTTVAVLYVSSRYRNVIFEDEKDR